MNAVPTLVPTPAPMPTTIGVAPVAHTTRLDPLVVVAVDAPVGVDIHGMFGQQAGLCTHCHALAATTLPVSHPWTQLLPSQHTTTAPTFMAGHHHRGLQELMMPPEQDHGGRCPWRVMHSFALTKHRYTHQEALFALTVSTGAVETTPACMVGPHGLQVVRLEEDHERESREPLQTLVLWKAPQVMPCPAVLVRTPRHHFMPLATNRPSYKT